MDSGKIVAPFDKKTTEALNRYQAHGIFHPFTCGGKFCDDKAGNQDVLIAKEGAGWVCPCGKYTQDWAHDFMVESGSDLIVSDGETLIAGFMGEKIKVSDYATCEVGINNWQMLVENHLGTNIPPYSRSFDWLMPACKKFIGLNPLRRGDSNLVDTYHLHCYFIKRATASFDLTEIFNCLVLAIKFYNQNCC